MTLRRRDWNYHDELYRNLDTRKRTWRKIEGLGVDPQPPRSATNLQLLQAWIRDAERFLTSTRVPGAGMNVDPAALRVIFFSLTPEMLAAGNVPRFRNTGSETFRQHAVRLLEELQRIGQLQDLVGHSHDASPRPATPATTGPADLVGRVTGSGQVPSIVTLSLLGALAGWLLGKRPVEGALVGAGVAVVLPMIRGQAPAAPAAPVPPVTPPPSGAAPRMGS